MNNLINNIAMNSMLMNIIVNNYNIIKFQMMMNCNKNMKSIKFN